MLRFCRSIALAGALCAASAPAIAESPTVLVLDASGSMWAQLPEGRSRIEVARSVLGDFLTSRDPARPLGVVAYGHNRRGDCSDIETIAPLGLQDGVALGQRLRGLNPKGKTPLTDALRRAVGLIPPTAEEGDIVLITDGLETCSGDPCALAAELAASGLRVRAHVVGFGLTEGEVRQMACLPEATGGLLLNTDSGTELAEALGRTAERPATPEPAAPGRAKLNLTIRASSAGRPDEVRFSATSITGEVRDLGLLVFEGGRTALPVDLEEGPWLIRATTEGKGEGQAEITVAAGDDRTIYVPFTGIYPDVMLDNRGPYEAGVNASVPYEITNEGLALGGADFLIAILPVSERGRSVTSAYERESLTWHYQVGRLGTHVASVSMPPDPGRYLLSFYRDGEDPVAQAIVLHEIEVATAPEVSIDAPPIAAPGTALPITIAGGQNNSDVLEIWQNGEAVDRWNQSLSTYLHEVLAGNGLSAPDAPGTYEIVYLRSNAPDDAKVAARVSLEVGTGDPLAEIPDDAVADQDSETDTGHGPDDAADGRPWTDYPFACLERSICDFRDPQTSLAFTLLQGWVADQPSLAPMSAGAAAAGETLQNPFVEFYEAKGNLNSMVLNPRQWLDANGPCVTTRGGDLCLWRNDAAPNDPAAVEALSLLQLSLTRGETLRRCDEEACDFSQRNPPFAGKLPARWGVEVARALPDGRLATWFFDQDGGGNFKLMGLNQLGGEACVTSAAGQLCEFTPYISSEEASLVAAGIGAAPEASPRVQLTPEAFDDVLTILKGK